MGCSRDPNLREQKYFKSGQNYFQQGQYREAAIEFFNAAKIDPSYTDAHYQLARSYIKTQQWGRASEELARTLELQPENYPAHLDLANLMIAGGRLQPAQEQIDLLLQKQPNDPQVHVAVSSLMAARGNFPGAVAEMQKAVGLGAADSSSYLNLALLEVKNNEPAAAQTSFDKAIELNPKALDAQMLRAGFLQSQGRYSEAEQQFRSAVAVNPKDPSPRVALAHLYFVQGRKKDAEDLLRQSKPDFPDNPAGYRMLADFYYATGDADQAVTEYGALHLQHPKDVQVEKAYIQLLIVKNRLDEARKLDDELLQYTPQDSEALMDRGQIQMRDGHASDAVTTLQTVVKSDPENALAHYHLGVAFERLGNLSNAEGEWRDAAHLRPDLAEAQQALAGAAMRTGDMAGLGETATQIIRLRPASPDGYALRAISNINRRQFDQAEADIESAIHVAPGSAVGYVQSGNLRFVQKKHSDAERAYRDALKRDPNSTDALRGLMNASLAQGQVDRALAAVRVQISKSPNNSDFYDLLGTALFRNKKDLAAAEAAFTKAVELNGNNADASFKLGQVQAASGATDQAIATCRQSLQNHPREISIAVLLGQLYESKQDWSNAQQSYQKVLDNKPGDPLASGRLAYTILQSGGNLDVALSLAQAAHRGMPDSPAAADTLGWVYYRMGSYPSAIRFLQEALRRSEKNPGPDDSRIHYHLGLAYAKAGQPVMARQQWQLVLRISPNSTDAADARKQLDELKS